MQRSSLLGNIIAGHIPDKDKPIECGEVFVSDVLLEIRDIVKEKVL